MNTSISKDIITAQMLSSLLSMAWILISVSPGEQLRAKSMPIRNSRQKDKNKHRSCGRDGDNVPAQKQTKTKAVLSTALVREAVKYIETGGIEHKKSTISEVSSSSLIRTTDRIVTASLLCLARGLKLSENVKKYRRNKCRVRINELLADRPL